MKSPHSRKNSFDEIVFTETLQKKYSVEMVVVQSESGSSGGLSARLQHGEYA